MLPLLLEGCFAPRRPEELDDLEYRVARLEQEVRELRAARKIPVNSPVPAEPEARARLKTLLDRRRQLLRVYTERHPQVILLDREIHELKHLSR